MRMDRSYTLDLLRKAVEEKVGRVMQTPRDFDYLAQEIFDRLHENISSTTLKRFFGYLPERTMPSQHTLCLLARFVGYNDWNDFCRSLPPVPDVGEKEDSEEEKKEEKREEEKIEEVKKPLATAPTRNSRNRLLLMLIAVLAIAVGIGLWSYGHRRGTTIDGYVLQMGQDFSSPDDYLAIFGVQERDSLWWVQPMPHRMNIIIWTPEYRNSRYHNLGNPDSLYPTITEHWEPGGDDGVMPEVVSMRNKERYIAARQTRMLRVCFMKNLRPGRYTFLGVYRLWLERSDTTQLTWTRIAKEVDLNNLNYLEQLR